MKSELVVDVSREEVSIALLEDSRLVSLQKESRNIAYAVGDLYLAKVKKLMPGLNAAFVDVGYEKDAFLHYLDLGPQFNTYIRYVREALDDKRKVPSVSKLKFDQDIPKQGTIQDVLKPGDQLLVQVAKEPISTKGPRLTTEISFTGRFMVLMPFGDKISISQKIKSTEEKIRLRQLIGSIKPKGFSVIVRTSAENKRVAELNNEMRTLLKSWEDSIAKMQRAKAPALVYQEDSRTLSMIRDLFAPTFENIHVNDKESYEQIRKYVSLIAPEKDSIVQLYDSEVPIFDHYNITRQIKSSFGKTVSFRSGAYLIIEHTEALHVIDVNSGNRSKSTPDQESNALDVNLKAADEIARQLRLRDMGGIIVVDFIDMAKQEHRQELYDHMREIMANDRARHNILPLSKFGLMQITRQRVRPVLDITVDEECPSCLGKGRVNPSILFTDTLFEKLEYMVRDLGLRDFILYVHPYVDAYLKKGLFSTMYGKWRRTLGRCFKILPDESLAYLQYRAVGKDRKEIPLRDEKDSGRSSDNKKALKARTRGQDTDAGAEQPKEQPKPQKPAKAKEQPKPKEQPKEKELPADKTQPAPEKPKDQAPVEQPAARPKLKAQKPKPQPKPAAAEENADRQAPSPLPAESPDVEAMLPAVIVETPSLELPSDESVPAPAAKRRRRRRRPKAAEAGQETGVSSEPEDTTTEE